MTSALPPSPLKTGYRPGEITALCDAAIVTATATLDRIASLPHEKRSMETTLLAFENAMADFSDATLPLTLMGYVYPDPAVAAEGSASEEKAGKFAIGVFTRRDLYDAIRVSVPRTNEEERLLSETLRQFKKNGLALPDEGLARVRALKEQITELEVKFSANLNNDTTSLDFSAEELAGVPQEVLATFSRAADGRYRVTTKYPDYIPVMQNAKSAATRKQLYAAFVNRQASPNTALLEEAIRVRQECARELGYASWADFRLDGRMAENTATVHSFLNGLKEPVKEKVRSDLATLLALRQELVPGSDRLDPWDLAYLTEQERKRKFALDNEEIRKYFPFDFVLEGMFRCFGPLFGIRFTVVPDAPVWAPGVRLIRILDRDSDRALAYLYLDMFPRDGKYGHMMMSPLIAGREREGGYAVPVTAIVGNFRAPSGEIPSLLTHDDVEGLFHEFGHALHGCLTRAPYASLAGSSVEWDFVETPSQALENWAWEPEVLDEISGHYANPAEKLPAPLRDRIIAARDIGAGLRYTRMLVISTEDMVFHTAHGPVDVTATADRIYRELMGIPPLEGGHEPATIGHFMGGYDAGYYSYLWAEVYALNVFARFKKDGLFNAGTGAAYRHWILEQGNMQDGKALLKGFLGKEPGMDVFYERLHIRPPSPASP
ncbi:M3 family metallopeptidase [Methanoregula sp.]|uniref:M3 family metallopeptidase n=1 Tax=Methanoregula sp. TaxID=2052170 RepID=UPI002B54B4C5|nr:M3 family metallopeptidase [Methanoregula sp.]HVP97061.1 M3 family metallopeptidase [Methanoregula sp.]